MYPLNLDYDPYLVPEMHTHYLAKELRHARRKHAQAARWSQTVLPALIRPFMQWKHEQMLSRQTPSSQRGTDNSMCSCSSHHRPLKVVCVSIEALCDVDITVCTCRPAPQQLVKMGYFPCSPVYPMLAVSLDMLELVSTLFVLAAPNERAWATTITKYLKNHGHEFATGDALRHQFSSALSQYQVLMQLVDGEMGKIIDDAREKTTATFRALDDEMPVHGREYANVQMLAVLPGVHLIVCLDANFQLKRNRDKDRRKEFAGLPGSLDPKVISPRTIFLSEVQIWEWEERVEVLQPSKPKTGHKQKAGKMEETKGDLMGGGRPDEIEPGMNLPNATYDACRDSFVAADGDHIKALSTYFDSTGVMALLCPHDHPLLAKKQFYALALISALMELIPNHWRVRVLYNIGCQMHRTLQKWDLMPEYLHRLKFAVSIFHAYGHQWACQLWYHPRKAAMWGLSDGEGCERFWSDLQKLIPGLHVAGLGEALMAVGKCPHGLDVEGLLVQFNEQREFQTKSVDRQSKTKGTRVIEQILSLEMTVQSQHAILVHLLKELGSLAVDDSVGGQALREEWKERVKMAQDTISRLEDNIARKTKALRLEDRASADCLANLKKDKWINLQLNILVLHDQLITKLCARKFELANLEHAHASRAMDQKTKSHVEKAVKQHAPGIEATVHKYNAKQKEMLKEQGKNGVRRDAYVPPELVMEGLFNLDIDQDIWENANMVDFEGGEIPLWLANKEVWDGIRAAQEVKSCQEELRRCDVEYSNLRAWFVEEYEAVHNVFKFGNGTWECSLATITIPVGAVGWSQISMPPPVNHPWTCRKALQGIPQLGERDEDGDASSDDDDGVELEPVAELEDVGFLGDLDRLIGEGDWSEGEGQDNVMVDL
ncbi:hypothetical protein BS47DRAFT_1416606 [Hydnum rufescens UP504]|uniref:CxC1-like cysteine cluster associated with KDZ transposases domain-containing protein n=1 Tax=Hydnum rufescens UP504 TaxID=1448309 RepID=A0A9P6DNX7_9AGAM|nr:hypothetical protein BS47DRAFT_1416606 [Hydnum rufescens UP504]